jgi:hypothetical protein
MTERVLVQLCQDFEFSSVGVGYFVGSASRGEYLRVDAAEFAELCRFMSPTPPEGSNHSELIEFCREVDLLGEAGRSDPVPSRSWFDRFVYFLHDRLGARYLFTPLGYVLQCIAAAVAMSASFVFLAHNDLATRATQVRPLAALFGMFAFYLTVFVHEIGHASVLAHHGRHVGAVGFELHLGEMSLYVDSSEVFFLGRSVRMHQAINGILFQLVLAGCYVPLIALQLLPYELNLALSAAVAWSGISAIWNLLPFLEFDGYWLATEMLSSPLLLESSRDAVRDWFHGRSYSRNQVLYGLLTLVVTVVLVVLAVRGFFWWYLPLLSEYWRFHGATGRIAAVVLVIPALLTVSGSLVKMTQDRKWANPGVSLS